MAGEYGVSAPWPAEYGAVVRRLSAIAEHAVAAQPDADVAIRACGVLGTVSSDQAVRLGAILRIYSQLYHEAKSLEVGTDPDLLGKRRDLVELLSYHLHMLRDAGDLVFSGREVPRNARFRLELARGLGPRAEDLQGLLERLVWDRQA